MTKAVTKLVVVFSPRVRYRFQATKVKVAYAGDLVDVFSHRQLTIQDDAEVSYTGGGNDDVISMCRDRSMLSIFSRLDLVPNQMTSVLEEFSCRRLDEHHVWMDSIHSCILSMVEPICHQFVFCLSAARHQRIGDD